MANILGKVTTASYEIPRGADVALRVVVPAKWLAEGSTIEVELPRNLICARCSGGGCSACNNSGAITLRGRTELPEVVQVVLPMQRATGSTEHQVPLSSDIDSEPASQRAPDSQPKSARPVVIRIPECGGLPDAAKGDIVRGWLLLEVGIAGSPSPNVRWLDTDEDPLSSSKMLRAEVRPSNKEQATSTAPTKIVNAMRSIRAPQHGDDTIAPPASRIAKVGSTAPPDAQLSAAAQRDSGQARPEANSLQRTRARAHAYARWIYVGMVLLAAIGLLALIFF